MLKLTLLATLFTSLASAPQSFAHPPITFNPTPIVPPSKGTKSWSISSQSGYSSGSKIATDSETHSGASANLSKELTRYISTGENYQQQSSTSSTSSASGGSIKSFSAAINAPSYDNPNIFAASTNGGSANDYTNQQSTSTHVTGGFSTQGVSGSSYTNNQISQGGSAGGMHLGFTSGYSQGSTWYHETSYDY